MKKSTTLYSIVNANFQLLHSEFSTKREQSGNTWLS